MKPVAEEYNWMKLSTTMAVKENVDLNFDFDCDFTEFTPVESRDIFEDPAAAPAPKKRRFGAVSDGDVTKLLTDSENKNTRRKIDSDLRLVRQFIGELYIQNFKTPI